MRFLQIGDGTGQRRAGVVDEPRIVLLDSIGSIYELAQAALANGSTLEAAAEQRLSTVSLDYDAVYNGSSPWRILPAMDHPDDPAHCIVSGTGLTHRKSAQNRQAMHAGDGKEGAEAPTDGMRMYQWGVEGGRPAAGEIGVSPEWFYKGTGTTLRAHGEPLEVPPHAEDGGEEPEIAGVYLIDAVGTPRRIGMSVG